AGVAMLAGIGAGVYSGPGEAVTAACHPAEPLLPDPGRAGIYEAAYRRYRAGVAPRPAPAGAVCPHAARGGEEGRPVWRACRPTAWTFITGSTAPGRRRWS